MITSRRSSASKRLVAAFGGLVALIAASASLQVAFSREYAVTVRGTFDGALLTAAALAEVRASVSEIGADTYRALSSHAEAESARRRLTEHEEKGREAWRRYMAQNDHPTPPKHAATTAFEAQWDRLLGASKEAVAAAGRGDTAAAQASLADGADFVAAQRTASVSLERLAAIQKGEADSSLEAVETIGGRNLAWIGVAPTSLRKVAVVVSAESGYRSAPSSRVRQGVAGPSAGLIPSVSQRSGYLRHPRVARSPRSGSSNSVNTTTATFHSNVGGTPIQATDSSKVAAGPHTSLSPKIHVTAPISACPGVTTARRVGPLGS